MWTTRFLYYLFLCISTFITSVALTELAAKEIRLLDQIDNSQVLPGLITNLDQVLNNYIRDHISVETNTIRAIVWDELPSNNAFEHQFKASFKTIKYDETFSNLIKKQFDYTRQGTFQEGRTWERFVYVRVPDGFLTLFFSYTIKQRNCWFWFWCSAETSPSTVSNIESFIDSASVRMFNKLLDPNKSIYSHGLSVVNNKYKIQFFIVSHHGRDGYIEKMIPSFEDGLGKQEQINKQKLSSCILMIKDGQKSLHSIRHPIIPGYIVPDFHAYYGINPEKTHSTPRTEL